MPPAILSNGLFISEILADNAGNNAFDTDGDGGANKADEFVEIQAVGGSGSVDLAGLQVWSAQRGLLFDFGATTDTVSGGGTATVVGQYDGAEPAGFYDAGIPDNNGNGGFLEDGENNKFDTIYLVDTTTMPPEYVALSYGQPPQVQPLPPGFPGVTLVGSESINSGAPNGTSFLRDANGDLVEGDPTPGVDGPVCFTRGTQILTPDGERAVEDLAIGDMVVTKDNGAQPIRWIGCSAQRATGKFAPVVIRKGAIGNTRDLVVSQHHKVLVTGESVDLLFGEPAVLCAAKHLVNDDTIFIRDGGNVEYFHVMFDDHQIITSDGALTESFFLGETALDMLDDPAAQELRALFPELSSKMLHAYMPIRRHEAAVLHAR